MKKTFFCISTFAFLAFSHLSFAQNDQYAAFLSSLKDQPIKLLGLGIGNGDSVKFWENYFKNGNLYFLEMNFSPIEYFSDRSLYLWTNLNNSQDLEGAILKTGCDFDVIIDDGDHTANQQTVSFQTLFPYVKKGGIYLIKNPQVTDFLKNLDLAKENIQSINFFDDMALVIKK